MGLRFNQLLRAMGSRSPVLRVSATSGVAPMGIVVDGAGSGGFPAGIDAFHDVLYFFDFGDTDTNVFTYGTLAGTSKNRHVGGPVSCYVYETPGTYTVRMWAFDGTKVYGPLSSAVTVTDPNTVYAGTLTVCISSSGTFTGAPSGATLVTSSDAAVIATHATNGKRVLLRAGEVFTLGASISLPNARSDILLGAFGTGVRPIIRATAAGITLFRGSANGTNPANNPRRWRVTGLRLESGGFANVTGFMSGVIAPTAGAVALNPAQAQGDTTVHDVEADGVYFPFNMEGRNMVGSKLVSTNANNGVAAGGAVSFWTTDYYQVGVIDCSFDNNHGSEHVMRTQGGKILSIRGVTLKKPAATKHYLAIRGDTATRYETEYVTAAGVFIDGASTTTNVSWSLQIAPNATNANEPISNVIVENSVVSGPPSGQDIIIIEADDTQVRNTVVLANHTAFNAYAVRIARANTGGLDFAKLARIRNVSAYYAGTQGFGLVKFDTGTSGHEVRDVIGYAPSATRNGANTGTGPDSVNDLSTGSTVVNTTSDANVKALNPLWTSIGTSLSGSVSYTHLTLPTNREV